MAISIAHDWSGIAIPGPHGSPAGSPHSASLARRALRAHLQRANDARDHTQHAGIHAARAVARRRRLGEQAAVAGACKGRAARGGQQG